MGFGSGRFLGTVLGAMLFTQAAAAAEKPLEAYFRDIEMFERELTCIEAVEASTSGTYDPGLLKAGMESCGRMRDLTVGLGAVISGVVVISYETTSRNFLIMTRAVEECRIVDATRLVHAWRRDAVRRLYRTATDHLNHLQLVDGLAKALASDLPAPDLSPDPAERAAAERLLEESGLDALAGADRERAVRLAAAQIRRLGGSRVHRKLKPTETRKLIGQGAALIYALFKVTERPDCPPKDVPPEDVFTQPGATAAGGGGSPKGPAGGGTGAPGTGSGTGIVLGNGQVFIDFGVGVTGGLASSDIGSVQKVDADFGLAGHLGIFMPFYQADDVRLLVGLVAYAQRLRNDRLVNPPPFPSAAFGGSLRRAGGVLSVGADYQLNDRLSLGAHVGGGVSHARFTGELGGIEVVEGSAAVPTFRTGAAARWAVAPKVELQLGLDYTWTGGFKTLTNTGVPLNLGGSGDLAATVGMRFRFGPGLARGF